MLAFFSAMQRATCVTEIKKTINNATTFPLLLGEGRVRFAFGA